MRGSGYSRRDFLHLGGLSLSGFPLLFSPLPLFGKDYDLEELERYRREHPSSYYWKYLKDVMFDPRALSQLVPQCALAYRDTRKIFLGECTYFYGYAWWRVASLEERRKIARFLVQFADEAIRIHPDQPFGYCTKASAFGLEILTLGVLEGLHYLPHYQKMISVAVEKKPDYSFGLPLYLMAAMYVKAPPFPISIGSLEKAQEYFARAYPYARGRSALYYVFYAEFTYLATQSLAEAKKIKRKMLEEMDPPNQYEVYTLDIAISDMDNLLQAIESGTYDKYRYSPLLKKAESSGLSPGWKG